MRANFDRNATGPVISVADGRYVAFVWEYNLFIPLIVQLGTTTLELTITFYPTHSPLSMPASDA